MSTPAFVAQGPSTLSEIRFYTAFDPYFYTVDNRPLQDIQTNLVKLGSQGSDSARRAELLSQLGTSSAYSSLFSLGGPLAAFMTGLPVSLSGTSLTVGAGAVYYKDVVNADVSTQVVKQALLIAPQTFTLTTPPAGQVKNVLVQAELRSLTQANMASSTLPFLDASNPLLECLLLNQELVITVKQGDPATPGNQQTPVVDSGKIALFVLTYNSTTSLSTLVRHASAPLLKGADKAFSLVSNNTLPADANNYIVLPVSLRELGLNPVKPISFQVRYSSSASGGSVVFKAEYRSLLPGTAIDLALTSAGTQTVVAPATANTLAVNDLTTVTIPNTAFAGWNGTSWEVTSDSLNLVISRMGADVGDTNTGTMTLHEVRVFQ